MRHRPPGDRVNRRDFARLLMLGGAGTVASAGLGAQTRSPLAPPPAAPDERYWRQVRDQFSLAPDFTFLNAANLCPASVPVVTALEAATHTMDRDPSSATKAVLAEGKERTRKLLAASLRVTPEEVLITRNTSEANNLVSSGLTLAAGDEVVIFSDNHPSNNLAWKERAQRFGFIVKTVDQVNPHPGAQHYVEAFIAQTTARTKVWAFTHVTNTVGDVLPVEALCFAAYERGALTLVDGAQAYGVLDVDLSRIQPDFYSASAHKWPCGPKETGLLFVNARSATRLSPSIISLYAGATGVSKKLEGFGQRDDPAVVALSEAVTLQSTIGRSRIEARSRELAQAFMKELAALPDVTLWTHREHSAAVVSFQPGSLNPSKLAAALYQEHRIACSSRGGTDRPGLRLSPHFYNLHSDVDRTVAAVKGYLRTGV